MPSGGHFGVNRSLPRLRQGFYWPTCKFDVEEWCASCHTAQGGYQDDENREVVSEIGDERIGMDEEKKERSRGERMRRERTEAKKAERMEEYGVRKRYRRK